VSIGGVVPRKVIREELQKLIDTFTLQILDAVDGELTVAFDVDIPAGTTARAEVAPDTGGLQLKLFRLTTDPEVQAEVYVVLGGKEVKIAGLGENRELETDADDYYGDIITTKLILVGKTTTTTTAIRATKLKYSGRRVVWGIVVS